MCPCGVQRPDVNDESCPQMLNAAFEKFRSAFGRAVSPFEPINDQNPWVKRLGQSKSTQQLGSFYSFRTSGPRSHPPQKSARDEGSGRRLKL